MRTVGAGFDDALTDAPAKGIVPRQLFSITVKDRDTGDPVTLSYWSGDYDVTISVISGLTGEAEERVYVGGVNLEIGDVPRVADLTVQAIDVTMSAIADSTQQLVRTYDARLAKVEIHSLLLDTATRFPVGDAEIEFLGEVDEAPLETGAVGGDSVITMKIRSDAISMLTRTNPRKRSHEGQRRRLGDEFARYSNSVATWKISWGAEQQA